MGLLKEQNELSLYAGLLGLYALANKYEFDDFEEREPLNHIIE